ncbi:MAG: argininosuccinate lyase [Halobacteria archaeon]
MTDIVNRGRLDADGRDVDAFLSSFGTDRYIFDADIDVGLTHTLMLEKQGIVSEDEAAAILEALLEVKEEGFDALDDSNEDVHPAIEQSVIEKVGEDVGGKLHTARSRNDEVATCIRIRLRRELIELTRSVLELREALLGRAVEHLDDVVPGYTHLQRAQPTTVAHYLLAYERAFSRHTERIYDCYRRVNRNPLGSAAFAGTGFDIDRMYTTELLGFASPTRNSMDGVAARDFAVESASVASGVAATGSRISEDFVLWSSHEFGYLEVDDAYASSSSIMPQKKNPDTLELARGKTSTVYGGLSSVLTNIKSQPMAYNRDLQELTGYIWTSIETTREVVDVLKGVVNTAEFNVEEMEDAAESGFSGATELADTLVRNHGFPFRTAHHLVATLARKHRESDDGLSTEDIRAAGEEIGVEVEVSDEELRNALDPGRNVELRDSYGGPGEVDDGLEDARQQLERDLDSLNNLEDELRLSDRELQDEIQALVEETG